MVQRNPAVAGLAASVALTSVLGAGVSTFYAIGERRERIQAERTFAQSLVRPLDPSGDETQHETLSEPELAALWELALHQGRPIGQFALAAGSDRELCHQRSRYRALGYQGQAGEHAPLSAFWGQDPIGRASLWRCRRKRWRADGGEPQQSDG